MGNTTTSNSRPRKRYASRQSSRTRKTEVAGTSSMAPKEAAPPVMPSVRPRRVRNHWLTILVRMGPVPRVMPVLITPNTRYSCHRVLTRGSNTSMKPMITTPLRAAHLASYRSARYPASGRSRPEIM